MLASDHDKPKVHRLKTLMLCVHASMFTTYRPRLLLHLPHSVYRHVTRLHSRFPTPSIVTATDPCDCGSARHCQATSATSGDLRRMPNQPKSALPDLMAHCGLWHYAPRGCSLSHASRRGCKLIFEYSKSLLAWGSHDATRARFSPLPQL